MASVVKMDEFTAKLVEVYDIVHAGPLRQKVDSDNVFIGC